MGARHAEFALGLWLLVSPMIFGHLGDAWLTGHDLLVGGLVVVIPLLCYVRALHRAHLLLLPIGAWLFGHGWWITRSAETPASQNHITVGLLIMMIAIIPSRAIDPPTGWYDIEPEPDGEAARKPRDTPTGETP